MLRIYGSAKSRALRTLWMVGELGIPYEHKDWLPRAPETKTPEYHALNPNDRVPTIDDDGFILSESMAINLYLAKKHKSPLYPADPKNEALALQWSLWETDRLDRQIVTYCRHTKDLPAAERKPEVADAAWKEIAPAFDALEAALDEIRVARRPGVFGGRSQRCRRTLPRADARPREMAARQSVVHALLGTPGCEEGARDARVTGTRLKSGDTKDTEDTKETQRKTRLNAGINATGKLPVGC